MATPLIEVQDLHAGYGKTTVLNGIGLSVQPLERLAVIGRNGVGKTTLMRALMGLCPASSGRIVFQGQDITHMAPHQRAALGLGYVPQTRDIFPSLTVEENLMAGLKSRPQVAVQEAYEANTRAAIELGVFGAPSYVVDGEIFWGQDRLDFLARKLGAPA